MSPDNAPAASPTRQTNDVRTHSASTVCSRPPAATGSDHSLPATTLAAGVNPGARPSNTQQLAYDTRVTATPVASLLPRSPRYRTLDAWRGIACLAVVIYHSWLYYASRTDHITDSATSLLSLCQFGRLGVPIFFVISGYCIAATADSARRAAHGSSHSISQYFLRRFRRIFPPYWAVVIISAVLIVIIDVLIAPGFLSSQPRSEFRPWWFSPSQWLGNLTLTETWRHHIFGGNRAHYVGQSWTLCYEEQFYAVVGVMLLCASRRFFLTALLVTIATCLFQAFAAWQGLNIQGFFFDGSWLMFAAGILVYYFANYADTRGRMLILLLVVLASTWQLAASLPLGMGAATASIFALVLILLHRFDGHLADSPWLRPFAICGVMCYSLYLVHHLLVNVLSKALYVNGVTSGVGTLLITMPLCLAVSLAAGWAFYQLVERRFLNPSHKQQKLAPAPLAALSPANTSIEPSRAFVAGKPR